MFKLKKVVDERQELELLKIEKKGFWVLYWMLLASFLYQEMIMHAPFSQWAAEFIVFMIASIYIAIACMRKGQWDYYSLPSMKGYFIYSLVGSGIFAIIMGISKYMEFETVRENFWTMGLPIVGILFITTFVLMFLALAGMGYLTKKRRAELEKEYAAEEELDDDESDE